MKPLHDRARRIITEGSRADVSARGDQARLWESLSARLDAPLPPQAAAADHALRPTVSTSVWSSALMKIVLCGAVATGVATGITSYARRPAPVLSAAPQHQPQAVAGAALSAAPATPPPTAADAAPAPARAAPAPHSAHGGSLKAETQLIAEAQSALSAGDAARALTLLERHTNKFPHGELIPEREAARVLALCALHRDAQAQAARKRFERDWPTSPLLARVRASCEPH